ncbi:MerR family transcriptional regulator [Streptomyces hainanensis]|uniref:MerR family transcriptional regulator n=1 Tax=Streptomyces hainanensis TaxID=402648 RepID=A0A4R4SGB9_9ACTN|nr:MerR family transcriptional regulator [Streptomyces hainanensis]TDC62441.1 MerR family transcriptional regulator [Streptomyces hainanensis]
MRIGELADIVGVTPRAVRHYHRIGLLPEPARHPNGYRDYTLRDAVELARVRRLRDLGLSLDEVRDVLAEDAGKDLVEVLAELDADLARQDADIRRRRARLAQLLRQAERGGSVAEAPVSPELAALFDDMARASAERGGPEPAWAARERELLAMLETGFPPSGERGWLDGLMAALSTGPEAVTRAYEVYARFDELADAAEDDPRVERTARAIADGIPDGVREALTPPHDLSPENLGGGLAEAFFAEFTPAQAAAVRRAVELLREPDPQEPDPREPDPREPDR